LFITEKVFMTRYEKQLMNTPKPAIIHTLKLSFCNKFIKEILVGYKTIFGLKQKEDFTLMYGMVWV